MRLALWRARDAVRLRPAASITLMEMAAVSDREVGRMTLRFRLEDMDGARLEALGESRRAMIREEWTRGLEPGEPSLSEAEFTARAVQWEIPIGEQASCRQKVRTLVERANRRLEDAAARPLR